MIGVPVKPGCVVASRITGSVISGRGVSGAIVFAPDGWMLYVIVSVPGCALALMIAWRIEPSPLSSVLVTVKLEAGGFDLSIVMAGDVVAAALPATSAALTATPPDVAVYATVLLTVLPLGTGSVRPSGARSGLPAT